MSKQNGGLSSGLDPLQQATCFYAFSLLEQECNIRSDDSVLIHRLSQSYVSNNTFQGIIEVFTQIR